jgi:hypothetical protein
MRAPSLNDFDSKKKKLGALLFGRNIAPHFDFNLKTWYIPTHTLTPTLTLTITLTITLTLNPTLASHYP